jgi:hypothetical protein
MKIYEEYIFFDKSYDMRLGTYNVRSLYRAGSLLTVSKYKLDLVAVQEVK